METTKENKNAYYEEVRRRLDRLSEDDVAVFDLIGELPQNENIYTASYVLMLCREGRATCRVGEKEHTVERGDLFLCQPRLLVENAMASFDFKCQGLIMSEKMLESILFLGGKIWDAKFIIRDNPVIHLTEEEMETSIRNNDFLRSKLEGPKLPHHKEMLRLLLQSMVHEFYDMMVPKLHLEQYNYTSGENLFSRFMDMAAQETPRHRDVRHYADALCITPKYLSYVCKSVSGQTASAILNNLTCEYIKRELRQSTKSVKEIAASAGFDNLSFFGKYVRRELGVSPREYRQAPLEELPKAEEQPKA